jgi:carbamate kinase
MPLRAEATMEPTMTPGLLVIALGGNALSPPAGDQGYATERAAALTAARQLAALAAGGHRLLVVHGNGPQVGRLLGSAADTGNLDIHVAQTQGELGYLLAEALEQMSATPTVALVTRALVDPADPAFANPTKPIGPLLPTRPASGPAVQLPGGWRRTVASPHPQAVVEERAIATLLREQHVIAGGGGGIAIARTTTRTAQGSQGLAGVIDKDWIAARLAVALNAQLLVFATNVAGVEDAHCTAQAKLRPRLSVAEARELLAAGVLGAGSMAPKVESAVDFVVATGRPALILHTDVLAQALEAAPPGTVIVP